MVSLIDIVPQTRVVPIAGGELTLHGLGLRQIANLMLRFPTLRKFFAEGAPAIDFDELILVAPDAVGAIIAEAANQPDAADTVADRLAIDDIAECLLAVVDLTIPGGPAPFLARLKLLFEGNARQYGKALDMHGPPVPNGSSQPDTIQTP